MTMIRMAGTIWSGAVRAATMTGGIQATKGPKKGMAMSAPERTAEAAVYCRPRTSWQASATTK